MFSNELARRYADQGVVSNSVNPGQSPAQVWYNVDFSLTTVIFRQPQNRPPAQYDLVPVFTSCGFHSQSQHSTELTRDHRQQPILFPAPYGALTQLWVGTAPEAGNYNGAWFIPWARPGRIQAAARNQELGTKLWDWIEEQRKGHF